MASINDFGLTDNGFKMPTKTELLDVINSEMKQALPEIDLSEGSIYNIQSNIFNDVCYQIFQNQEAQYYQSRPEFATGNNADTLFAIADLVRIPSSPSYVDCVMTGNNSITVPAGTQIANPANNDIFTNAQDGIISTAACVILNLTIENIQDSTQYVISIDGTTVTFTSGVGATESLILQGLLNAINDQNNQLHCNMVAQVKGNTLMLTAKNLLQPSSVAYSSNILVDKVSSIFTFTSNENGPINVNANSITKVVSLIAGLDSVYNPFDGQVGRVTETTQDFRNRFFRIGRFNRAYSTVPAIENAFSNADLITGISYVRVKTNDQDVSTVDGQPPHSVHLIVEGGSNDSVAELLWNSKPSGIATYGNTSISTQDANGQSQIVKFSRPVKKYIWLKIELTQGGDYTLPSNYSDQVKAQVLNYAKSIAIGDDIIPMQIVGYVAINVRGVKDATVRIGVTQDKTVDTDPDPLVAPSTYVTDVVTIQDFEIAMFDTSTRVNVSIAG